MFTYIHFEIGHNVIIGKDSLQNGGSIISKIKFDEVFREIWLTDQNLYLFEMFKIHELVNSLEDLEDRDHLNYYIQYIHKLLSVFFSLSLETFLT